MKHILTRRVKDQGVRSCSECRSTDLEYFDRVYIEGELFSFPYAGNAGLCSGMWWLVSI